MQLFNLVGQNECIWKLEAQFLQVPFPAVLTSLCYLSSVLIALVFACSF